MIVEVLDKTTSLTDGITAGASIITAVVAVFGGCHAYSKWNQNRKFARVEKFREIVDRIRSKEKLVDVLYMMDDECVEWYGPKFSGKDKNGCGRYLDEFLYHISYVLYLYNEEFIDNNVFSTLAYDVERVLSNFQLQEYFYNLKMYALSRGVTFPYQLLVDYGLKKKILDENIFGNEVMERNAALAKVEKNKYRIFYDKWLQEEKIAIEKRNGIANETSCSLKKDEGFICRILRKLRRLFLL